MFDISNVEKPASVASSSPAAVWTWSSCPRTWRNRSTSWMANVFKMGLILIFCCHILHFVQLCALLHSADWPHLLRESNLKLQISAGVDNLTTTSLLLLFGLTLISVLPSSTCSRRKKASPLPNSSPPLGSQTANSWSGRGLVLVGGKLVRGSNSHLVRITASTHRLYCSIFLLGIQNGCKPGNSLHWEMWEVLLLMCLFFSCNKASTPCLTRTFCNILFYPDTFFRIGVQAK